MGTRYRHDVLVSCTGIHTVAGANRIRELSEIRELSDDAPANDAPANSAPARRVDAGCIPRPVQPGCAGPNPRVVP